MIKFTPFENPDFYISRGFFLPVTRYGYTVCLPVQNPELKPIHEIDNYDVIDGVLVLEYTERVFSTNDMIYIYEENKDGIVQVVQNGTYQDEHGEIKKKWEQKVIPWFELACR